jgi:hypothetical protein
MIHDLVDYNYTGFAYVIDGVVKSYKSKAVKEFYWIYVSRGYTRNNFINGYNLTKITPTGSKIGVIRVKPEDKKMLDMYYIEANSDKELFRYDGLMIYLEMFKRWIKNFLTYDRRN